MKVIGKIHHILITARNEVAARLCFYTCLWFYSQGVWYPSMHCRWYPIMPCSRSPGGSPGPHLGGGCIPTCTEADPSPSPWTATAVGGTYPTGMHSCLLNPWNIQQALKGLLLNEGKTQWGSMYAFQMIIYKYLCLMDKCNAIAYFNLNHPIH